MDNKALAIKMGRPSRYANNIPSCVMNYTKRCLREGIFPTIEGLAINLGTGTRTLYDWEKEYTDFSHTLELLRDTQRDLLIKNGLTGKYSTSFAIFLLKAIHGYTDSKALFEATQNNYMDISPDVLADALKLMGERGETISTTK